MADRAGDSYIRDCGSLSIVQLPNVQRYKCMGLGAVGRLENSAACCCAAALNWIVAKVVK